MDIDFDAENQDDIVRTIKKLSNLMNKQNIDEITKQIFNLDLLNNGGFNFCEKTAKFSIINF